MRSSIRRPEGQPYVVYQQETKRKQEDELSNVPRYARPKSAGSSRVRSGSSNSSQNMKLYGTSNLNDFLFDYKAGIGVEAYVDNAKYAPSQAQQPQQSQQKYFFAGASASHQLPTSVSAANINSNATANSAAQTATAAAGSRSVGQSSYTPALTSFTAANVPVSTAVGGNAATMTEPPSAGGLSILSGGGANRNGGDTFGLQYRKSTSAPSIVDARLASFFQPPKATSLNNNNISVGLSPQIVMPSSSSGKVDSENIAAMAAASAGAYSASNPPRNITSASQGADMAATTATAALHLHKPSTEPLSHIPLRPSTTASKIRSALASATIYDTVENAIGNGVVPAASGPSQFQFQSQAAHGTKSTNPAPSSRPVPVSGDAGDTDVDDDAEAGVETEARREQQLRRMRGGEAGAGGGVAIIDDEEMDGKPLNAAVRLPVPSPSVTTHPEASTLTGGLSQFTSLEQSSLNAASKPNLNGLDIRSNSLDSFGGTGITGTTTDMGLSTIPNQFCCGDDAVELRKLLLQASEGRTDGTYEVHGAVACSTAVMDMYMVGKVVGVGSYGKVRAAWHRLTTSKVAIKTYDKGKIKDPAHWKRVNSEISIMEQVSHPRIARMFEAVETPKRIHLIMECLEGGNLCTYVKQRKRLTEEQSRIIFFQVLQGIEYLHRLGVTHRDVKLDARERDVKIIDFGFSTISPPGKRLKVFCGTPSYMAPEIVRRTEYEGHPVDMWSLGILLYALLMGCFPFRAKTYPDLYRRIIRGTFLMPDELPAPVRDLISQLLIPDPATRLTAVNALRHPWLQGAVPRALSLEVLRKKIPILISDRASDDVDEDVLVELIKFGLSRDQLSRLILGKVHCSLSTLYYLLRDIHIRKNPLKLGTTTSYGASTQKATKEAHISAALKIANNNSSAPNPTTVQDATTMAHSAPRATNQGANAGGSGINYLRTYVSQQQQQQQPPSAPTPSVPVAISSGETARQHIHATANGNGYYEDYNARYQQYQQHAQMHMQQQQQQQQQQPAPRLYFEPATTNNNKTAARPRSASAVRRTHATAVPSPTPSSGTYAQVIASGARGSDNTHSGPYGGQAYVSGLYTYNTYTGAGPAVAPSGSNGVNANSNVAGNETHGNGLVGDAGSGFPSRKPLQRPLSANATRRHAL